MCCLPNDVFLYKGDFNNSPNVYQNKVMKGMRFRVLLDGDKQLTDGIQWDYLGAGGFQILIPGWEIQDETLIIVQFY